MLFIYTYIHTYMSKWILCTQEMEILTDHLTFSVVAKPCPLKNSCIWESSLLPFLLDSSSVTSVSILVIVNFLTKTRNRISGDCAILTWSAFYGRWLILPFHLPFRSPCEAGGSSSSWPPFYTRHLSDPHTPLSRDSDWNMDYHKELLAVRG